MMMKTRKNKLNKQVRKMHRWRNKMMLMRATNRRVKKALSLLNLLILVRQKKNETTESYIDTPLNPIIIDNLSKIA